VATRTRRTTGGSSRRSTEDSGGRLNRDYGDEEYREPGEGYNGPTPKKGLYPAKLVSINDHVAQNGEGNESVRWGFELTGGTSPNDDGEEASVAGFRDYQYTNDSTTLWREQQIAVALGLVKPNGKLNKTYAAILKTAKPCTVRIIRERYVPEDGGDPEWRAKIAAVLKAREDVVGKSRRAKAAEPDEDAFDDEDEEEGDEDEDEEETPPARSRRTTSRSRRKAEPEPDEDEEEEEPEEEDEEDDEDEPYDADALAAELEDLSLVALKKRARDEFKVKITRGMKAEDIIEAVLDTLDEDEEEEEEEPPPPPKRAAKGSTRTTARKRGSSTPPPF
jgi:hypothetical protein